MPQNVRNDRNKKAVTHGYCFFLFHVSGVGRARRSVGYSGSFFAAAALEKAQPQ